VYLRQIWFLKKKAIIRGLDDKIFDSSLRAFDPDYRVVASELKYSILLELPSMTPSEVRVERAKATEIDSFGITLSGQKIPKMFGENKEKEQRSGFDRCRYGKWSLHFNIPTDYRKKHQIEAENGVVIVSFEKDDEN